MDNYIEDHFQSNEGYNTGANAGAPGNSSLNMEDYQQINTNQVPRLTEPIHKGNQSALAARMQELRERKGLHGRASGAGAQRRELDSRHSFLKEWNNKCQIQNITIPQIISNPNCSKRYRITLTWIDETGRPHRKDINFGEEGKQEYVDHEDSSIRDARIAKLEEETLINPLHPNFWEFHLLNKYPDLNVAYFKFIQENNLTGEKVVLKKEFRQNYTNLSANHVVRGLAVGGSVKQTSMPTSSVNMNYDLQSELEDYKYK